MTIGIAVIGAGMAGRAHAAGLPDRADALRVDAAAAALRLHRRREPGVRRLWRPGASGTSGPTPPGRRSPTTPTSRWSVWSWPTPCTARWSKACWRPAKHVLCEKPLSDTLDDARAMAEVARTADTVARIGFTFRRAPGVAALRELVTSGALGRILHVDARYWCDYASDPQGPISWRYKGAPGSGALADIGSHASYLAEFLCGDIQEVSGGRFATAITERPVPLGAVIGHGQVAVSEEYEAGRERRLRQLQRPVRERCRSRAGLSRRRRPPERSRPRDLRRPGRRQMGAGATRRVPAHAQRRTGGSPRLPAGDHRPGPPVRRRRTADGRAGGRLGPERRIRLPGTGLPGGSRRLERGRFAAALRVLRRRRAQHGDTGCRRRLRRSRRGLGQGRTSRSRWHREVRRLQRNPARSVAARGPRGHRRPRPDRHRAQLGRLPARGAHPDLRRHPHLRHGARRLPRPLRGHRRRDRRAQLQRQPAASRPRDRIEARRGRPPQHPAGEPAGPAPGGHHVGPAGRGTGR